jgi:hypothetical protein
MSGRHRRPGSTPAHRALLGTVPLVGGAGLVTGLLAGAAPQPIGPAAVATTLPPPAEPELPGATASGALPGRGETAIDAVAGARDAALAREAAETASADRVSTVADELRAQADERAERARAAGDSELADYHRAEAERQEQAAASSRPVVPADTEPAADPGAQCRSADLLQLGPLSVAGPDDPDCEVDPWVAGQVQDSGSG